MFSLLRAALSFALGIGLSDALQQRLPTLSPAACLLVAAGILLAALLLEYAITHARRQPAAATRPLLLRHLPLIVSLLLLTTLTALGAWRYQTVRHRVAVTWPDGPHDCRAIVRSAPTPRPRSTRYLLDIDGHRIYAYAYPRRPAADHAATDALRWGDTLTLRAVTITPPQPLSDTLSFDYPRYLYTHRISGTLMLPATAVVAVSPATASAAALVHHWRSSLSDRLHALYASAAFPDDVTAVVTALSLGDRHLIDDNLRDAYAEAGASHLLALSGMHVGVLYALLAAALAPLLHGRRRRRLRGLLAAALLWAFAFLTGMSPSLVRAVTMCTLYALVNAAGGDRSPLDALALTAILMLAAQPFLLFDIGFQLSFASMFSILLLMPLYRRLVLAARTPPRRPLLYRLGGMAAIAVAAQAGAAPLQLCHFGRFPTWFLVTNLAAVPLVEAVMVLLTAWLLLSLLAVSPAWTAPLAAALAATVRLMNSLLIAIARWPASSLHIPSFDALDAALIYLLYFFLYRYLLKKHTPSALWALGCVAFWLLRRLSDVVFPSVP